jgi:DNA-binding beta-propeller fold protein YncE
VRQPFALPLALLILALAPSAMAASVSPIGVELEAVWTTEHDVTGRGRLLAAITGGEPKELFVRPYAAIWMGSRLYVTDPGRPAVIALTRGERPLRSRDGAVRSPVGVAVCEGSLFVSDSERGEVIRFSPDLRTSETVAGGLSRPTGVACVDGRLFVLETGEHRIVEIRDGRVVSRIGRRGTGDGEFNFPTLLAYGGGELFVGDAMNFRIQRFTPAGEHRGSFGELGDTPGSMPRMKGLAVDGSGAVWMTDAILDRVAVYDDAGRFLLDVGRPGRREGEFSFPAGIAIGADGRVAVVDSFNARVQLFRFKSAGGAK